VDSYAGNSRKAAEKAGLTHEYARKLMANHGGVKQAICSRVEETRAVNTVERQGRQIFWTQIMLDKSMDTSVRPQASELLGRSGGDFLVRPPVEQAQPIIAPDLEAGKATKVEVLPCPQFPQNTRNPSDRG